MAIRFDQVKPGDTLYDVKTMRAGTSTMRRQYVWEVEIFEVDTEKRKALVSWNRNQKVWWYARKIENLRRSPPKKKSQ